MNEAAPVSVSIEPVEGPAFIPLSRSDILKALLAPEYWHDEEERALAACVFNKIGCLRQHKSSVMLNELNDVYDPFNPDDETVNQGELSDEEKLEQRRAFHDLLKGLIVSANYTELTNEAMEEVLAKVSPDGVNVEVDFSEFDLRLIFYRGEDESQRAKRDIRWAFLKHVGYVVPIYRRLIVALKFKPEAVRISELMHEHGINEEKARRKLKRMRKMLPPYVSTDHIYLKTFKNIPRYDVEMLFPNIRVKMKYRDKVQLGGSAVFGAVTYVLGTAAKFVVAIALSPMMIGAAIVTGVGGIVYAQIRNIFITRDRYRMQLAQSLYFQNLANNQGALALIVDDAEEEDVKEELLLYAHMLGGPVHESQLNALRGHINKFVREKFGVDVNFDIDDALERLMGNDLVRRSSAGELNAMPLSEANKHLHDRWCKLVEC